MRRATTLLLTASGQVSFDETVSNMAIENPPPVVQTVPRKAEDQAVDIHRVHLEICGQMEAAEIR